MCNNNSRLPVYLSLFLFLFYDLAYLQVQRTVAGTAIAASSEFTLINVNNFTLRCSSYADKRCDKDISCAQ